ncbi:MAG: hypothetical protein ACP5D7_01910 [Limnospira sp.]
MNYFVASPPQSWAAANLEFDTFMLQFTALEGVAIEENYSVRDRITAFRKIYYNSQTASPTYGETPLGGGSWNLLIPGAHSTPLPSGWSSAKWRGAVQFLRSHQAIPIHGTCVDIGHLFAGADAGQYPDAVNLAGGLVRMRSNQEAATFVGDLGSVVVEYIYGNPAPFADIAKMRSPLLETYYDGDKGRIGAADMAGNADSYAIHFDRAKTLTQTLLEYYTAPSDGAGRRYRTFAQKIGLGTLDSGRFSGDTPDWRRELQEQVFNAALAYAAATGRRGDVVLLLANPAPDILGLTPRQAYWNVARWVVDLFVIRIAQFASQD